MNFQGREIFKIFLIDRLNRMTLVLDNSLFSKKDNFSGKSDHMNVCTSYFLFVTPNKE